MSPWVKRNLDNAQFAHARTDYEGEHAQLVDEPRIYECAGCEKKSFGDHCTNPNHYADMAAILRHCDPTAEENIA